MTSAVQLAFLSILNWLHLLAVVVWIGAMSTNMLVLMPAAKAALPPPAMGQLLGAIMKRFRVLAYTCMAVLVVTGILMMVQNAGYNGFMKFDNAWTIVLLVKHIVVAALIILGIYSFEILAPKVGKLAAKGPSPELARMQATQMNLAKLGFVLGLLILLFTAVDTALSALHV